MTEVVPLSPSFYYSLTELLYHSSQSVTSTVVAQATKQEEAIIRIRNEEDFARDGVHVHCRAFLIIPGGCLTVLYSSLASNDQSRDRGLKIRKIPLVGIALTVHLYGAREVPSRARRILCTEQHTVIDKQRSILQHLLTFWFRKRMNFLSSFHYTKYSNTSDSSGHAVNIHGYHSFHILETTVITQFLLLVRSRKIRRWRPRTKKKKINNKRNSPQKFRTKSIAPYAQTFS